MVDDAGLEVVRHGPRLPQALGCSEVGLLAVLDGIRGNHPACGRHRSKMLLLSVGLNGRSLKCLKIQHGLLRLLDLPGCLRQEALQIPGCLPVRTTLDAPAESSSAVLFCELQSGPA